MSNSEKHSGDLRYIYARAYMAFALMYPMDKSMKYEVLNYKPEKTPAIYAIWHGSQYGLLAIKGDNRKKLNLLISKSNDGEIIAKISTIIGFSAIRGSHKRGGTEALRHILKALKQNQNLVYTVDGPKGPIYKVKEGIIRIAQMSGAPIIPIIPECTKKITINSWDKYKIPLPFSRIVSVFGDPIYIPKDINEAEVENQRLNLENKMFELQKIAQNQFNKSN